MAMMSELQKWIVDEELQDLIAVLPKNMKVRVIRPYVGLEFKVQVQHGYYKNKVIQFLVHIPRNYNKSPPVIQCLQKVFHKSINPQTGILTVQRWSACNETTKLRIGWNPDYNKLEDIIFVINSVFEFYNGPKVLSLEASKSH